MLKVLSDGIFSLSLRNWVGHLCLSAVVGILYSFEERKTTSPMGGVGNPFCQTDRGRTLIVLDTTHKRARETAKSYIRARGKTRNT